jgi:hypothetical protein
LFVVFLFDMLIDSCDCICNFITGGQFGTEVVFQVSEFHGFDLLCGWQCCEPTKIVSADGPQWECERGQVIVSPDSRRPPAGRETAAWLVEGVPGRHHITVDGDKAYDTRGFVQAMPCLKAVPHVSQDCHGWKSAIDGHTTRHPGYAISQRLRKRVEEIFGLMKTVGNLRKSRHRSEDRVGCVFTPTAAGYNMVCIRDLTAAVSP